MCHRKFIAQFRPSQLQSRYGHICREILPTFTDLDFNSINLRLFWARRRPGVNSSEEGRG